MSGVSHASHDEKAEALSPSAHNQMSMRKGQGETSVEDITDDSISASKEPSSGPIRTTKGGSGADSNGAEGSSSSKTPIAAPVKAACTFCRSRKSRCNGKQPCAACVSRSQPDDCHYTISRRGGKPKPKTPRIEPMETHLEKILDLSDLPHLVRIPNAVLQLQGFMMDDVYGSNNGASTSGFYGDQNALTSSLQSPTFSASTGRARSESIQVENSPQIIKMLLQQFYDLFYRFIPILPGPHYLDQLASTIPSDSPFILSLQCVLPVIRNEPLIPITASTEDEKKTYIRLQSAHLAKRTESAIDALLERVESHSEGEDFHTLEVIQALCMLIIYEYGGGRALKARLKADTALGIAMSKGLHRLSAAGSSNGMRSPQPLNNASATPHFLSRIDHAEMHEVRKRMWWSLWSMTMWTAYNTGRIPTIRADDARVTCELPMSSDGKAWTFVVSSLQGLLLVQDRVLALSSIEQGRAQEMEAFTGTLPGLPFQASSSFAKGPASDANHQGVPTSFSGLPTMASRNNILQSMQDIDRALQNQMVKLEQSTHGVITALDHSNEQEPGPGRQLGDDTQYLHFVWAIQLYTASLTLHVGQAFQGATLFERKLCFLSSISESNDAAACQVPMPNAFSNDVFNNFQSPMAVLPEMDLYARGPFLPKDSLKRCVDASDKLLAISRNLRRFKGPFAAPNNPFNACSFVLISFVCLMQALAISTNVFDSTEDQSIPMNGNFESNGIAPSLLKSAQGAAALNVPSQGITSTTSTRQQQLQSIWARVKEAKGTLQELARHWDMVIPMAEEVGGCLEASQFLLSQDSSSANSASNMTFPS